MPARIPRPCREPGCAGKTTDRSGRCEKHRKHTQQQQDRRRGTSASRGYNSKWRRASLQFRQEHPLCKLCLDDGEVVPSEVTDHIVPHKGDLKLFWRRSNWQALCKRCHDRKTATEDGGFGR